MIFLETCPILCLEDSELVLKALDFRRTDIFRERPFLVGEARSRKGELDGAEADGRWRFRRGEEGFQLVDRRGRDTAKLRGQPLAIFLLGGQDGLAESGDLMRPVVGGIAMNIGRLGSGGFRCACGDGVEKCLLSGGEGGL